MIAVGGLTFEVQQQGPADGPLVLLLHGFPESSRTWHKVIRLLGARGLNVVAPDLRGYGESSAPEDVGAYHLDALVGDVIGLADKLGADKFALAGHDWGGIIAWAVAARHPERIDRLIILNAPHPDTIGDQMRRHPRQMFRSLYVLFFQIARMPEKILSAFDYRTLRRSLVRTSRPFAFDPDQIEAYVAEWKRPGRISAMLNYYRALRLPREPLRPIAVPVLILWGMKDRFLGAHFAAAGAALCEDAEIVRFKDATHWIQHEEPRRVATEIARFLRAT